MVGKFSTNTTRVLSIVPQIYQVKIYCELLKEVTWFQQGWE